MDGEKKLYTVRQKHTVWLEAKVKADSPLEAKQIAMTGGASWEVDDDTLCEDGPIEVRPNAK